MFAMMQYVWSSYGCQGGYLFKTDDDVVLDMMSVRRMLEFFQMHAKESVYGGFHGKLWAEQYHNPKHKRSMLTEPEWALAANATFAPGEGYGLSMDLVGYIAARSWKMTELQPEISEIANHDGLVAWSKTSAVFRDSCVAKPQSKRGLWASSLMQRPLPKAGLEDVSCGITLHEIQQEVTYVTPPCFRLSYHWACALSSSEKPTTFAVSESESRSESRSESGDVAATIAVTGKLHFFLLHHLWKPADFAANYDDFQKYRHPSNTNKNGNNDEKSTNAQAKAHLHLRGKVVHKGMVNDGKLHTVNNPLITAVGEISRMKNTAKLARQLSTWAAGWDKGG
jgi:hypothetical protein